jgi:hypothetical protein
MANGKKARSTKKTTGKKAARPPGMPSKKNQILIKGPDNDIYILTKTQLKKCSDANRDTKWGKLIRKAYKDGELPLESCDLEEGVDDWDIWPTNR